MISIEKLKKLDNLALGLVLGFLAPIIALGTVYLITFDNYTIKEFVDFLKTMRIMTKLFSLCLLSNLAVFFLFIWPNFLKGARGTLFATIIIAVTILIIQFLTVGFHMFD